jgi:hypothetical protein
MIDLTGAPTRDAEVEPDCALAAGTMSEFVRPETRMPTTRESDTNMDVTGER